MSDLTVSTARSNYQDDNSIAAGLRRRDPLAMEALYDGLSRQAFGLAYRMLGDTQSAEDVVQEAFLSIWRAAERVDTKRGRLQSYVLTVVHRRAIDVLRTRKGLAPPADNPPDIKDERADVASTVEMVLDAQAVRTALGELPAEQKAVVEMAYYQGLTHVEIAEKTNLPLGTVKSRLRLALDKIRVALAGHER
jgi:RNA polymerase sigma-70 factor (ECF subfamily)